MEEQQLMERFENASPGYIRKMEGRIYNAEGLLTATGSSVAKVIRK